MNSILGKWIKKRNKSDFVVLILLGVMVMIVAMPTGAKPKPERNTDAGTKGAAAADGRFL